MITSGNAIDAHDTHAMAIAASGASVHYSADGVTWTTAAGGSPTRVNSDVAYPSPQAVWSVADSYALLRTAAVTSSLPDYVDDPADAAGSDWGTPSSSMAGACLRALTGAIGVDWTVDADGTCSAADSDPWRPIVASSAGAGSSVARTTATGASATAHLRFGVRAASSTPALAFAGTVRFEVVSPGT